MNLFDEDVPKKSPLGAATVGEELQGEINRTQKELEQRGTIRDAANSIFQK